MPSRSGERNLHRDILLRVVRLDILRAVLGPELVHDLRDPGGIRGRGHGRVELRSLGG
jgi:hypothetical protein